VTPQQFALRVRDDLHARRWLRWHCFLIATLTLAAAWACSHTLMRMGVELLSLRYATSFVIAYLVLLGLLYVWAQWLLSRDEGDGIQVDGGGGDGSDGNPLDSPVFKSGEGGDFGGAGGGGSFDMPSATGDVTGEVTGGVLEVAAGADEGALVLVPLALVVGIALVIGTGLGFVVFGLFGVEVLLAVAVEIAIASVGGALAFKAGAEGWFGAAWRRTRTAAVVALIGLLALGAAIDHWLPQARSLPHALQLMRGV
jgi:hypothetical protein